MKFTTTTTINNALAIIFALVSFTSVAQTAIWVEDFDDGGGGRWTLENAPGSLTNPTPAGIPGLTYGVNAAVAHDNWVINDRNTPELTGNIAVGLTMSAQGQFVRGRHYACSAPSNLPNPFVNTAPGPNQSLHITAYPTCATLLYGGTAQSDDWNCISDPDNGDIQTQTEQIAYLNNNIDATGKCNMVITADFFIGGDADGIKSHGTILYSTDAGATWKVVEDFIAGCSPFLAGTCNNWHRRSFAIPADANNQNDLRIAFRWYDDGDIDNTGDYALGASFNVDNIIITACDVPTPDFSVSQTTGCKGETFYFTDLSTVGDGLYIDCATLLTGLCTITDWSWDISKPGPPGGFTYVNGTSATSQHPEVVFTANGTYSVELTVTNCAGDGVLLVSSMIVIADCPPTANFITSQLAACADPASEQDTVSFTDLSTTPSAPITSWSWTFTPATVTYVNGTTASDPNIDVVFDAIGTYQVALTVTSSEGSDTETKIAYIEAIDCNCGGGGGGGPVTVFEEDFDGNGGAGSNWAVLNSPIGAQGDSPNIWYISDQESGEPAGACGTAGTGDKSLHISSTTLGDLGAAYDAGGWCGFLWCTFGDRRSYSVNINTVGVTGLTLNFNYIELGEGADDNAIVEYSINGGASWLTLVDTPKPGLGGCAPQGTWTAYSIPLPATCENIANLRIAYRWWNDDDGIGTDPSFAVDDITITGTSGGGSTANTWEGDVSSDWNVAGNWSDGAVPTSATDVLVPATICGACVMPQIGTPAFANNVCNFGVITINTNNVLTIDGDLLNEGEITTTTVNQAADVVFANAPSIYKGSGTMYDVDVSVTSSDLTLETNLWSRSFDVSTTGTVDIDVYTLAVNRDLSKSAGTFTLVNGRVEFIDACGTCLDQANIADVTINANQIFGDVLVNKSPDIKVSLMSGFNYIINTPKTLTIQEGILDANTFTLIGTGNLTMNSGELQLAKCATVLPEITGTYLLPGGKITFDGICAQTVKPTATVGVNYYKVEFAGSGVKTLTGDTYLNDSLLFNLPTTLGNYVDAGPNTLFVLNSSVGIVAHTGGHVLGNHSRAITPSGGEYHFYVGSNNSDGETYFEPIRCTPNALVGPSAITARFWDLTPNPAVVVPSIVFGLPPVVDTIEQVETEGYWQMEVDNPVVGGNYTASVSPDQNYWTFAHPWGTGAHTLLKQEFLGDNWDYAIGGQRVDDSTTMTFADFSNYVLAFAKNGSLTVLSVELADMQGYCESGMPTISWATFTENNASDFIIERSYDGVYFEAIGSVEAVGNSTSITNYAFTDTRPNGSAYYRLSERNVDGEIAVLKSVYIDCAAEGLQLEMNVYPNPSDGEIQVTLVSGEDTKGILSVRDVNGRLVHQERLFLQKGVNAKRVELNARSGLYLLSVETPTGFTLQRIEILK